MVNTTTGSVAQQIVYDEFGNILSDSSPGFQPFGFAGGLYDNDSKLVHFNAREYDPESGRWMTKDPILFNGGDTNLYGYVLQDPVNFIDPEGTCIIPAMVLVIRDRIQKLAEALRKLRELEQSQCADDSNRINDELDQLLNQITNLRAFEDALKLNDAMCGTTIPGAPWI